MKQLALFFVLLSSALFAEISLVTIYWVPGFCPPGCEEIMARRFSLLEGVDSVAVDRANGVTYLRWRPNFPYDAAGVVAGMAWTGLAIYDVGITLRGTLQRAGSSFAISSLGDNSTFYLLGPTQYSPNQYVTEFSPFNRPLPPELIEQLELAYQRSDVVEVKGFIFMPYRQTPQLIINSLALPPAPFSDAEPAPQNTLPKPTFPEIPATY